MSKLSIELDKERYTAAAHGMQSGVAMELNYDSSSASPKHLRVGINSAMVNDQVIARLLIAKGIITEDEYVKTLADCMEEEKAPFEMILTEHFGRKITLA